MRRLLVTAISTPFGLYELIQMQFGLRNATQTFQRFVDMVLKGLDFVYIDNILIASSSLEEHFKPVEMVLARLNTFRIVIIIKKCVFDVPELEFLGVMVSKHAIKPATDKIAAIKQFPLPEITKKLQRFLGMINYYRRWYPYAEFNIFVIF